MADGVWKWKGVYFYVFGRSPQLLLHKFFDLSTPFMRKGRDGGEEKNGGNIRMMKIVATTSLPAVDRPNADRWNTARLCQFLLQFELWRILGKKRLKVE